SAVYLQNKNNTMNAENTGWGTSAAFKWGILFVYLGVAICFSGCIHKKRLNMKFKETQLTSTPNGHTIHNTQVFSEDDNWIVYDTRNDDTKIGSTRSIEMVNTETGEVK